MKKSIALVVALLACGKGTSSTVSGSAAPSGSASGAVASGSGSDRGGPSSIEAVLVELERMKSATCQCAEVACTDGVGKQLAAYRPTLDATVKATPPQGDQAERIARLEDEIRGCKRWVAAGLGSNSGGGETTALFEIALVELERHRNAMCACKDKACGDKVATDHDAWRTKTDAEIGTRQPNPSQVERRTTYEQGYADCRKKL